MKKRISSFLTFLQNQKRGAAFLDSPNPSKKSKKSKNDEVQVEEETDKSQPGAPKKRISSLLVTDEYASQLDVDLAFAKELQEVYEEEESYEGEAERFQNQRKVGHLFSFPILLYRFQTSATRRRGQTVQFS